MASHDATTLPRANTQKALSLVSEKPSLDRLQASEVAFAVTGLTTPSLLLSIAVGSRERTLSLLATRPAFLYSWPLSEVGRPAPVLQASGTLLIVLLADRRHFIRQRPRTVQH